MSYWFEWHMQFEALSLCFRQQQPLHAFAGTLNTHTHLHAKMRTVCRSVGRSVHLSLCQPEWNWANQICDHVYLCWTDCKVKMRKQSVHAPSDCAQHWKQTLNECVRMRVCECVQSVREMICNLKLLSQSNVLLTIIKCVEIVGRTFFSRFLLLFVCFVIFELLTPMWATIMDYRTRCKLK